MPVYVVLNEYKPFLDLRKQELPTSARVFCGECGKPRKMLDDDIDELLSKSDYCSCRRRRP